MKINGIYNGDIQLGDPSGSDEWNEPVTVSEFKDFARIDVADDDPIVEALIPTARQQCEDYLNISLVPREILATILCQMGNYALPYGPVISISSFVDSTDSKQTEITCYSLVGGLFKSIREQFCNPLKIVYNAGYTICPEKYKTAIKQQALYLYDNRGDETMMTKLSPIVLAMLYSNRRVV